MPDRPDPADRRYDWLFTEHESGSQAADEGAEQESAEQEGAERESRWTDEHTRMLRVPGSADPRSGQDPEPTRPVRVGLPPDDRDPDRWGPGVGDGPAGATSFGGTYARRAPAPGGPARSGPPADGRAPDAPPMAQPSSGARYAQPTTVRPAGWGAPAGGAGGPAQTSPPGPPYAPVRTRPGPSQPAPTRRRRRIRWVRWILAVLAAWLVFLVVVPIYAWSQVAKVDAAPSGARPPDGPGTNYLLVGSDSRAGLTHAQEHNLGTGAASGQRTDTIILLHVSSGGGPNVMLSIPRDSYVDVPGHGMNKINAAFAYGGAKLLVQTVERATKIHVDDYVQIGFTGVVDVVDAVGGITVCPKTAIHDKLAGGLNMAPGCQHVDGHTALDYSRSRAFRLGDITRALHQREVIAATGSRAASWQTVVFPWRYWGVNMAGAHAVTVGDNVGPFAFARFAWAMAHSGGPGTKRCVVPFSSLGTSTAVGSVVTWSTSAADALFAHIQHDTTSRVHCSAQ